MSTSNKNLLLIVIGIVIVLAAYLLCVKPNMDEKSKLDSEITQLQLRYNDLLAKSKDKDKYEAGIKQYQDMYNEKLAEFPATLDQEYTVEFIEGIRQAYEYNAKSLTMGEPEEFYVLGGTSAPAETAPAEGAETSEDGEAAPAPAVVAADTSTTDVCYVASFPIAYEGTYDGIKDYLSYIQNYRYRMTVDDLTIAYDAVGDSYTGSSTLTCYAITGPGRENDPLNLDIETGVTNIFTGSAGSSSNSLIKLDKYDEDNGDAIKSNYEFYVMLNPASSDSSPKVVGPKGKDDAKVTSDNADAEALTMEFYEKDGKKYVKYTLGTQSAEAEVLASEDVKILVNSTPRGDSSDKVGVNVTIKNALSIPVYVKVVDDDAAAPRFNMVSKSGQVKVY